MWGCSWSGSASKYFRNMDLGGDCECRYVREAGSKIISLSCLVLKSRRELVIASEKCLSFGLLVGPGESWKRLEVFVEAQVEAGQLLNKSRAVFLLSSR